MSFNRIIPLINQLILISHKQFRKITSFVNWDQFYELLESVKHHISIMAVKWNPSMPGFVKLNSDGCSKGNPGLSGGGEIIRDEHDRMISAYATSLGLKTNNLADALALKIGVDWCRNTGITKLEIECDSKLLVD